MNRRRTRTRTRTAMTGGGLPVPIVKKLLSESYNTKKGMKDIDDYKIDRELSGERVQVYHNDAQKQVVIVHRGTQGATDWGTDLYMGLGGDYTKTERFKHAVRQQKKAIEKYPTYEEITLGHSLGAKIAEHAHQGKEKEEVITLDKPVLVEDVLPINSKTKKKQENTNQTDVRTSHDVVSGLAPFQRKNKTKHITIESGLLDDPLKAHKTDQLDKLKDKMIGKSEAKEEAKEEIGGARTSYADKRLSLLFHRKSNDFNNATRDVFNLMTINGKYSLLGSSNNASLMYNSDYDLQEYDNLDKYSMIYKIFKSKFKKALNSPMYSTITDFKCGEDSKGEPLRWSYQDMMKGEKRGTDNKMYPYVKAISQDGPTIKLDMIALVSGRFLDFSDNYYFPRIHSSSDTKLTKEEITNSIIEDLKENMKEKRYMKVLKRSYSLNSLKGNDKKISLLDNYFNGIVGFYNKQLNDILVILRLLENTFRKPKWGDVVNNIQVIKQNLSIYSDVTHHDFSKELDKACKNKEDCLKILTSVKTILEKAVNANAYSFIKSHDIL